MKKNRGVEKGACSSLDPCRCDSSVEDTSSVSEAESAEGQGLPCVSGTGFTAQLDSGKGGTGGEEVVNRLLL